jgi:hypothetical protein
VKQNALLKARSRDLDGSDRIASGNRRISLKGVQCKMGFAFGNRKSEPTRHAMELAGGSFPVPLRRFPVEVVLLLIFVR